MITKVCLESCQFYNSRDQLRPYVHTKPSHQYLQHAHAQCSHYHSEAQLNTSSSIRHIIRRSWASHRYSSIPSFDSLTHDTSSTCAQCCNECRSRRCHCCAIRASGNVRVQHVRDVAGASQLDLDSDCMFWRWGSRRCSCGSSCRCWLSK